MTDRSAPFLAVSVTQSGKSAEPIDVGGRVLSMTYTDDEKKADKLSLKIDNFDLSAFDDLLFAPGNVLEVSWGYSGLVSDRRTVVVQTVKGGQQLSVEAEAKSVLMHRQYVSRTFDNVKRSDVARTLAQEHGFRDDQIFIDDTENVQETIAQARMTDAQFLRHLAEREGFEFFVDFDGFHWHERRTNQAPIRKFTFYIDPGQGDVIGFGIEESAKGGKGRVKAKGRNPDTKEDIDESSDNETEKDDESLCEFQLVPSPTTGQLQKVAAEKIGTPNENVSTEETMPTSADNAADAKRQAAGKFKRQRLNNVKLSLKAIGDPLVVAKSTIEVTGIGKSFSGLYYVESVKHSVSPSGYTMDLSCKRSGRNASTGSIAGGQKSEGKVNQQKADDPNDKTKELEPVVELVPDPTTGQLKKRITYRKRGRDQNKSTKKE